MTTIWVNVYVKLCVQASDAAVPVLLETLRPYAPGPSPLAPTPHPARPAAPAGLSKAQCEVLTRKWHIHLTMDGRISMAGLSAASCPYLAEAIADVVTNGGSA